MKLIWAKVGELVASEAFLTRSFDQKIRMKIQAFSFIFYFFFWHLMMDAITGMVISVIKLDNGTCLYFYMQPAFGCNIAAALKHLQTEEYSVLAQSADLAWILPLDPVDR